MAVPLNLPIPARRAYAAIFHRQQLHLPRQLQAAAAIHAITELHAGTASRLSATVALIIPILLRVHQLMDTVIIVTSSQTALIADAGQHLPLLQLVLPPPAADNAKAVRATQRLAKPRVIIVPAEAAFAGGLRAQLVRNQAVTQGQAASALRLHLPE